MQNAPRRRGVTRPIAQARHYGFFRKAGSQLGAWADEEIDNSRSRKPRAAASYFTLRVLSISRIFRAARSLRLLPFSSEKCLLTNGKKLRRFILRLPPYSWLTYPFFSRYLVPRRESPGL